MSGSEYTTTPNLGLYKPLYNADAEQWGTHLNLNADILDTSLPSINPITGAPGLVAFPSTDPYQSPDSYALTGSLTMRALPYGYYDTGALLSLSCTTQPVGQSRAGLGNGFENGVPAIAGYGTFDCVGIYNQVGQVEPYLVLHAVTYDATHVYPATPLTAAQMKTLRVNMWVVTNSIDGTVSTTPSIPNGSKPETHYASYVTGWATDGTSISVVGWTVPGSGHTTAGQIPSATLEPGDVDKTAYFGAPTGGFGANFVFTNYPLPGQNSRMRFFTGMEFDYFNYGSVDYEMYAAGIAMNYTPVNGARLTADSFGMKIDGFPTSIYLGFTDVGLNISANHANIISTGFNSYVWASPPAWSGAPVSSLNWESISYIDSNQLRLQCWTSRDVAGGSWTTASVHVGLGVDGTPQSLAGVSRMAQIVWNPQGFSGGLQLQNLSGVAALTVDVNAHLGFNGHATTAKPTVTGAKAGNAALASLLTALAAYGLVTDSST